MKISRTAKSPFARGNRGSGVLIVLVLMGLMLAFIMANASTLRALKQELQRVDRQQQKHLARPPGRLAEKHE